MSRFLKQSELESLISISIDASEVVDFVCKYYSPEEVFAKSELEMWAEENGFVSVDLLTELQQQLETLKG